MVLEWDEKKRRSNLRKHRLDFADARTVFKGPLVMWLDVRFDYGEPRFAAFGILRGRVVKWSIQSVRKLSGSSPCARQPDMKKRTTSKSSKTDWKALDRMRDEDIDLSDSPEATAEDFAKGVVRWGLATPGPKEQVTLRLDADVLEWFRARGKGYQTQINLLLRAYMVAHEGKSRSRRA